MTSSLGQKRKAIVLIPLFLGPRRPSASLARQLRGKSLGLGPKERLGPKFAQRLLLLNSFSSEARVLTKQGLAIKMNTVHFERRIMNPEITSKDKILAQCRAIAQSEGLNAITMRHVAENLDVSLGSLYHYYPSKDALILASVASIWHDIFHDEGEAFQKDDFISLLRYFFKALVDGEKLYPGFFSFHALAFSQNEKKAGVEERNSVFGHMKQEMLRTLENDPHIRTNAFQRTSKEDFVDLVFLEVLAIHLSQSDSEEAFLATIQQLIY